MRYVLFVCTHNAGTSQIAQALFERRSRVDRSQARRRRLRRRNARRTLDIAQK